MTATEGAISGLPKLRCKAANCGLAIISRGRPQPRRDAVHIRHPPHSFGRSVSTTLSNFPSESSSNSWYPFDEILISEGYLRQL
jgi:hypothetical protein